MINLHSVSKSREITLPTKIHTVKAMVFPVVTYVCESWTVKKNRLLDSVGEGEGGMIWENGIETCILSCKK